ncbi:hypothetical protein FA15DRAFT_163524 [Coprinopsis marcescibilis]|uniref:Uncharacterized protein n=1 Tax=Coprinopsis marcescibilis TaxID=230819 RepID=A0A5C3KIJ7_COPMA|nr:hypothetical protein FA15DRAFT_163524 [Coprinopsis marcescibilis]
MFSIAASYQSSVTVRTAPWMKDRTRRRACPTSSTFASLPSTLKSTTQSPSLVSVSDFPNNDIKGKRKRVDEDAGNSKRQRLENGIQATFAVATWLPPAPTVAKRKRTPCEGDLASEEALTASPSKKAKTSLSPPRPDIYTPTASQNAELGGADCPGAELGTHEGYSSGTPAARSDDSETQVQLTPIPALSPDSVRDSSLDEEPGCTDSPPPSEPTRNDKHEEQIPTEATRSTTRGVTTTLVVSTLSSSSSLPNVDPNSPPLVVGSVSLLDTVPPSPPGTERERRIQSCKVDYTDVGREDRRGRDYRVLALVSVLLFYLWGCYSFPFRFPCFMFPPSSSPFLAFPWSICRSLCRCISVSPFEISFPCSFSRSRPYSHPCPTIFPLIH